MLAYSQGSETQVCHRSYIIAAMIQSCALCFKNFQNGRQYKKFKNSKMERFQWKWIFTGIKTCCTILFPWERQPFWKNQPLKAQLHMPYDIPTGFHKV
jgi:hypothetical protein